jgi:hypothetical protein
VTYTIIFQKIVTNITETAQLPYKVLTRKNMRRPQKIIPPVKGHFEEIVAAISDGYGVKRKGKTTKNVIRATQAKPRKKL